MLWDISIRVFELPYVGSANQLLILIISGVISVSQIRSYSCRKPSLVACGPVI